MNTYAKPGGRGARPHRGTDRHILTEQTGSIQGRYAATLLLY
jgi:hypothetical protein